MQNRVPIVLAFTSSYLIPAATTVQSILRSSPKIDLEVICLLTEPLSKEEALALEHLSPERVSFRYVIMTDNLDGVYVDPKYSEVANYRLLVADKLSEWDRVIYLDCDIIVRQDLEHLYNNCDLGGCYMAGVVEASSEYQIKRFSHFGCTRGEYINSGVLVLNLKLIREKQLKEKFLEALRSPYLEFPDQDVINMVCRGKIRHLSPLYNGIRTFLHPSHRRQYELYYSSPSWWVLQQEATIHYTGEKPWRAYTHLFEKWWRVYWSLPTEVRNMYRPDFKVQSLAYVFSIPGVRALANFAIVCRNTFRRILRK